MPVDPAVQALLDQIAAVPARPMAEVSVEEARQNYRLLVMLDGEPEAVASVENVTIDGPGGDLRLRVYRPTGTGDGPLPVLVWFPGGGWVLHSLETADTTARRLANRSGALVVSVQYRAAPEHRFPAAVEDAWAGLEWVYEHAAEFGGDPVRLAVGGDSAGGNLAAVCAVRARDRGTPAIALQVLVYPVTDCTLTHPSMDENAEGLLLTKATMEWFVDHYLGPAGDPKSPLASPLYTDDLAGVARAYIITAEYDPLRDEGEAYADRLIEAGVPVELVRYEGMTHQFFILGGITPVALAAADKAAGALRAAFAEVEVGLEQVGQEMAHLRDADPVAWSSYVDEGRVWEERTGDRFED